MSNVLHMPSIPLDARGYPTRHVEAQSYAKQELMDLCNQLPDGIFHLHHTDADWIIQQVLVTYLHHCKKG